jgi:hypothetical protein
MRGDPERRFKPWEDEIILKYFPTAASKILTHRSRGVIAVRRHQLQHPDRPSTTRGKRWTKSEVAILRQMYPTSLSVKNLFPLLPGRSWRQMISKAKQIGIRRKYVGDHNARLGGHKELLDQIVIRAREDGIPIYKLDGLLKCGTYFQKAHYRELSRGVNLKVVARAVDFFGGTLVIDWRDR